MNRNYYNRSDVIAYAAKWAFKRNPQYYDFDKIGGDCTNFVSQCIYAGIKQMNYNKQNGWYYNSINDRSPSWTAVELLYKFLINNNGNGPQGKNVQINEVLQGDIIQLSFDGINFEHSLIILNKENRIEELKVAAHTFDAFGKKVGEYNYQKARMIHIT